MMQYVNSSAVSALGFEPGPDGKTGTLEVVFRRGGSYTYGGFTQEQYQELLNQGSIGRAVNCEVLGRCGHG